MKIKEMPYFKDEDMLKIIRNYLKTSEIWKRSRLLLKQFNLFSKKGEDRPCVLRIEKVILLLSHIDYALLRVLPSPSYTSSLVSQDVQLVVGLWILDVAITWFFLLSTISSIFILVLICHILNAQSSI